MKSKLTLSLVVLLLSACGGGGGGSSTPSTPSPTVNVSLSSPKIALGESVKVTWSSTNATTCSGTSGVTGVLPISGTIDYKPDTSGQLKITISCSSGNYANNGTQTLIVPHPVQRTSYLNFKNIGLDQITMPDVRPKYPGESISSGIAFGDFFQDGTYAAVTTSGVLSLTNKANGHIQFWKSENGKWVDKTSLLLDDDKNGCTGARKIVVADFNGDKKPDAFFACHGYDESPWPGDKQVWLYSQPNGKYKKVVSEFTTYSHGAAAADFSGDGYADIIITDTSGDFKRPLYLKNNRNESFTITTANLPNDFAPLVLQNNLIANQPIYTLEIADLNGDDKLDLFASGLFSFNSDASLSINSKIYFNDGSNTFSENNSSMIKTNETGFGDLDIIIDGTNLVILKGASVSNSLQYVDLKTLNVIKNESIKINDVPFIIKDKKLGLIPLAPFHY